MPVPLNNPIVRDSNATAAREAQQVARIQAMLDRADLVVFDLNGLIIDDEGVQHRAAKDAIASFGIDLTEERWITSCVGHRANEYFSRLLGMQHGDAVIEELVQCKNELYRSYVAEEVESLVRPGVRELIAALTADQKKLALATSALPVEIDIILGSKGLDLLRVFDFRVSGADISRAKPAPDTYLAVLEKAGVAADVGLALEDSAVGVDSAAAAGMPVIAVPNRFTRNQDFARAALVLESLAPVTQPGARKS